MKNCPGGGVQGNLNWMPGYDDRTLWLRNFVIYKGVQRSILKEIYTFELSHGEGSGLQLPTSLDPPMNKRPRTMSSLAQATNSLYLIPNYIRFTAF